MQNKNFDGLEVLSQFGQYLHYLKWKEELNRYETWEEAVDDVMDIHEEWLAEFAPKAFQNETFVDFWNDAVELYKEKKILGSQRILQMRRGILKHHAKVYNCITMYADKPEFFSEYMYWLLCGCGVGVSIRKSHILSMPYLHSRLPTTIVHKVEDSIEGWADAIKALIASYMVTEDFSRYFGHRVLFDLSGIRPKGAYISGGYKAPGPQPLATALEKIEQVFERVLKTSNRLASVDIYDIGMYIADAVISGGVRRSATIYLFDKDDEEMIKAKTGNWFVDNPQRARSNNSVALLKDDLTLEELQKAIAYTKQYGEPGVVLVDHEDIVFNPCVEIGMMPVISDDGKNRVTGAQGCNLTEINGKEVKDAVDAYRFARAAAFLGTIQASYTNFKYVSPVTKKIFDREALIGVSITGWFNNEDLLKNAELQQAMATVVKETNAYVSKIIGINPAARTTCVKPSGNASVVLKTSSGVTPEHSTRYFRNVQVNKTHPIAEKYKELNPKAVEESVWSQGGRDYVISFPVETNRDSIYKDDVTALEHLEDIKRIQSNWVENGTRPELCTHPKLRHNVSNTVVVGDNEWQNVIEFIYNNKEYFTGISLLSGSGDRDYAQAPFTEVLNEIELVERYGSAAIFASGLIVDALHSFKNLWDAIASVHYYNPQEAPQTIELFAQKDWVRRFKKFADNYFKGNLKETELCLKDCFNFHRWQAVVRNFQTANWSKELPKPEYTDVATMGAIACNGDSCVINLG